MKLMKKETLVIAGIYFLGSFLLDIFDFTGLLWLLAFIYLTSLSFMSKTPKFIKKIITDYPKTAIYLTALGLVFYISILLASFIMGYMLVFIPDNAIEWFQKNVIYYSVGSVVILILALVVATVKAINMTKHPGRY